MAKHEKAKAEAEMARINAVSQARRRPRQEDFVVDHEGLSG
jgi:hypothetical protein